MINIGVVLILQRKVEKVKLVSLIRLVSNDSICVRFGASEAMECVEYFDLLAMAAARRIGGGMVASLL